MHRRWICLALAIGISAVATADEVVLLPNATLKLPGGRVRGQITAETPTDLKINPTTGADQTIPLDQIESISYDGAPATFSLAETRANNGQFAEAADLYKKAATEATGKPFIIQTAQFRRAAILTNAGFASPAEAEAAIEELQAFVRAYPASRHLATALENLIRLHLQKGDTVKATAALNTLKEKVPGVLGLATILESKILAKSGKPDQAIAILDRVIAGDKESPIARQAQLAKAESLAGEKKYDEALSVVQQVIEQSPPEAYEIQAEAHNTMGDCYRAANRPKDALLAYLKTDILFSKDKAQHPKALAMIEQLFRELKADIRADEVHETLKQLYPQSPYLKK